MSLNRTFVFPLLVVLYTAWVYFLIGFRPDHYLLLFIVVLAYYAHPKTRRLVYALAPFVAYWWLYDSIRICPNYKLQNVHIAGPYLLEKYFFGIATQQGTLIPCEYFERHNWVITDVVGGLIYLNFLSVPLLYAFYLWWINKQYFVKYALGFLLICVAGFFIYYLYPAAPPWYVQLYGFDFCTPICGSAAGLARFDEVLGTNIFAGMYGLSPNIFGAMPSLHSAYPVLFCLYAWQFKQKHLYLFAVAFMFGTWFTAVYSGHHYIIDAIAGIFTAIAVYLFAEKIFYKQPTIQKYLKIYADSI
jgi:hypothetical protein